MTPEQRQRMRALFDELADQPPDVRERRLAAVAADDPDVAREARLLLDADAVAGDALDLDLGQIAGALSSAPSFGELPRRFGQFLLEAFVAEGGHGAVYRARRDGLDDTVAVKLLQTAWVSPLRRRRFEDEQRTQAALNHAHIAHILDAGVDEGIPWLAMELVEDGVPITVYCDRHRLDLTGRLRLFRDACVAVDYAHRKLTIHLDLKPSNVLVDRSGQLKIVDFGIAKRLEAVGGPAARTSSLPMLSIHYAAPEQIRNEALDVQADVHALGVLLYELVAGTVPVDLTAAHGAELERLLETAPPPVSSRRRTAPVTATASQWRELDTLCAAALHRDKAGRYGSADRLLADIDHFVGHQPLDARPRRTLRYRTAKFLRRHRASVAATAAAVAAFAALSTAFTLGLIAARDRAVASEALTQQVQEVMFNLFAGDDDVAGPSTGLRVSTLLERGARAADAFRGNPDLQAELRFTYGGLYHRLGRHDDAEPLLRAAMRARAARYGDGDPRTVRAQLALAALRVDQNEHEDAASLARDARAAAEGRATVDPIEVALTHAAVGKVLAAEGSYAEALPLLRGAVDVLGTGRHDVDLSEALGDLANATYLDGDIVAAEPIIRRGIALDDELFGKRHPNYGVDLYMLGHVSLDRGEHAEGERLYREALSISEGWYQRPHPKIAYNLLMVGRAVAYQGRRAEARAIYERALDQMRAVYKDGHARVGGVYSLMGDLAREDGRLDEADAYFRRAAGIFKEAAGEAHEFYQHQLSNLASVQIARGQHATAEAALRSVVASLRTSVPKQRYTAIAEFRHGRALNGLQRYADARDVARVGYQRLRRITGPGNTELADGRQVLIDAYAGLGQEAPIRELDGVSASR